MRAAIHRSTRQIALALLVLMSAVPAFAQGGGGIISSFESFLDSTLGRLGPFGYFLVLAIHLFLISAVIAILRLPFDLLFVEKERKKELAKAKEKAREQERERRKREGVIDSGGNYFADSFSFDPPVPNWWILLMRGIKSSLNPNADASKTATSASAPTQAASPAPAATTPSLRPTAPTAVPATAAVKPSPTPKVDEPQAKPASSAPVTAAQTPTPVAEPASTTQTPAPVAKPAKPVEDEARAATAPAPIKKSVFISYRRQDSPHITGRIYDRLAAHFGREFVYKDVDSIPLGLDFRKHLQEHVGRCAVLVAVIGKRWNPFSDTGEPRLSDPRDYLRIEVESALERDIPVIPVLVDGAEIPAEKDLPPSLATLAYRNGILVRQDPDFHHDLDRLERGIEALLK